MESTSQSRGSRIGRATHVSCPRCNLSYRATIWQVFEDVTGNCPRCLGLHSVEQAMVWTDTPNAAPARPVRATPNPVSTRLP